MREKIDSILANGVYGWRNESNLIKVEVLNQLLTLIREEIEKVENNFITEPPEQGIEEWAGFEHCRQKILSVLKEK